MHEDIIRFSKSGLSDNNAVTRESVIGELEREMREHGCVPSIDNEPQYTVEYLPSEECFAFDLSVYGVKIQEELDPWTISGVTSGKTIMRHIHPHKLEES